VQEDGHPVDAPVQPVAPQGDTHSLRLRSGGQVTLSVSVNVMQLSAEDRNVVFHLIDKLKEYESVEARSAASSST
jgi:hypothetical protein